MEKCVSVDSESKTIPGPLANIEMHGNSLANHPDLVRMQHNSYQAHFIKINKTHQCEVVLISMYTIMQACVPLFSHCLSNNHSTCFRYIIYLLLQ